MMRAIVFNVSLSADLSGIHMYHNISHLLSRLINGPLPLHQVYFASSNAATPELAYKVDFPRLEIVLEGQLSDTGIGNILVPGDVLYVPAGGWNLPQWQTPRHHADDSVR